MDHPLNIRITQDEIIAGIRLAKCQKCGCMRETLDQLTQVLPGFEEPSVEPIKEKIPGWLALMQPVRYACLGCEHCYAGAAQNAFTEAFPQVANSFGLSCEMQDTGTGWPLVVGEYIVVDITAPVAIATLASLDLGKQIVDHKPRGLSIVGKLETENIGIDKLIKNVIANANLRYLVLAGEESQGHQSGQTLLALSQNGVDENGQVIGANGKRPDLHNVTQAEIDAFRKHIQIVDMIGCQDIDRITQTVSHLSELESQVDALVPEPCGCAGDT
jgi:tetrahydromethanopterin S-methyltransferase subunit A